MDHLNTASFCAAFFSIMFVLALLVRTTSSGAIIEPNSSLPSSLKFVNLSNPVVPWTTSSGNSVDRLQKCQSAYCSSSVFSINLPVLVNPERPSSWDIASNAWSLTSEYFETGLPLKYPFATFVTVPTNTPEHVKYILPDALRSSNATEINITGDYENSFVVLNSSKHELYFYRTINSYWSLKPNSKTLLWPAQKAPSASWNAYTLRESLTDVQAAYFAELLMISRI